MDLSSWAKDFIRHPLWAPFRVKMGIVKKLDTKNHSLRQEELSKYNTPLLEALQQISNKDIKSIKEVLENIALHAKSNAVTQIPNNWAASSPLQQLCYSLCLLLKPTSVIETGVANGYSSRSVLQALFENKQGHLYSIELPPLGRLDTSYVGVIVPTEYYHLWTLKLGPSLSILPKLLRQLGNIDIFIHDSDHSYWGQKKEFELALKYLKPGGILISDDIGNDSFLEAMEINQAKAFIISQPKKSPFGILVKPK